MTSVEERAGTCPIVHLDIAPVMPAGFFHQKAMELRDGGPIWVNTLAQGFWMLTTHELVREMYQTPEIFTSDAIQPQDPNPAFKLIPTNINPPDHKKYRTILNPWFSPAAVLRQEQYIREIARRHVTFLARTDGCDVVAEFTLRLPTEAFLSLVGLPTEDATLLQPLVEDFFNGFGGEPEAQEAMAAAVVSIGTYFSEVIDDRRTHPRDSDTDFFTALIGSEIDGRPMTEAEIQGIALLLVIAGLDTTRAHLGWLLYHFAMNPDDRRRVIAEPELVPSAVEESLRYHAIIFGNGRKVSRDVEWHGCQLKRGDMVYGLNSAANRDPSVYENPDRFIIDRKISHHLGFAAGPHRCLGSHFARAELRIAVEEFHRQIPNYELVPGAELVERGPDLSLLSLPLSWPRAEAERPADA